jgi:hypothetical protein
MTSPTWITNAEAPAANASTRASAAKTTLFLGIRLDLIFARILCISTLPSTSSRAKSTKNSTEPIDPQRGRRGDQLGSLASHQTSLVEARNRPLEGRVIVAAELATELGDCQPPRVLVEQVGEGRVTEPLIGKVGRGVSARSGRFGGGGHDLNLPGCEPLPWGAVGTGAKTEGFFISY